jgi:RHS repeat-associated protein
MDDGRDRTFVHDARGRMIRVLGIGHSFARYDFAYGPDNLRVETVRNGSVASGVTGQLTDGQRTYFLSAGAEEVADLTAGREWLAVYVPGAGVDERVAQFARNPDASWTLNYIHADRQNSVTALSDRWGTVVQKRGYGAYGETSSAQMASHPFGYTGRRWVDELGLYYYRARWYDPQLGTFLQPDPIGSLDYINLYAYVGLEPGNATDPTGMQAWSCGKTGEGCENAISPEAQRGTGELVNWAGSAAKELFWGCLEGGCQGASALRIRGGGSTAGDMSVRAGVPALRSVANRVAFEMTSLRRGNVQFGRADADAITKIGNVSRNNALPKDFMGANRDAAGLASGGDHIKEMRQSISALDRASSHLQRQISGNKMSDTQRAAAREWVERANSLKNSMCDNIGSKAAGC